MSSTLEELMEGFYLNDYSGKENPKGYIEQKVQAFEMKAELQRLINGKNTIKTGYRGKAGSINRVYLILYKK